MSEWTDFMKGRMSPYMKKYGSHKKAIRMLSKDFKKSKGTKMPDELKQLKEEVEKLKKQKKNKMALATTRGERDNLLREINQLELIKKSPSALKKFGSTYLKGMRKTGKVLWRGIKGASRNLEARDQKLKRIGEEVNKRPALKPFSPITEIYTPRASPYYSTTPKRMKSSKRKKVKTMGKKYPSKPKPMMWDLP